MDFSLQVDDDHFEYLKLQKGRLWDISRDREMWLEQYENDLHGTFDGIKPFLPQTCWGLLDIGSGLGGIDVLIARHYAQGDPKKSPFVHLLDGVNDQPVVRYHRHTYNDMRVAKNFQVANGLPPERFGYFTTATEVLPRPYDLVVSFGSWCFHYEPLQYLHLLTKGAGLHGGSVVIVDVRADKPEWVRQLDSVFTREAVIATRPKWSRCVYVRR